MTENRPTGRTAGALAGSVLAALLLAAPAWPADEKKPGNAATARAALTVTLVQPQSAQLTSSINANGSIAAWQEAIVGSEAVGLRLAEVRVNVGDAVRRGQVLATFAAETLAQDMAQARAALAEAEAALAEASANARRARELQGSGALSAQQISQYLSAESTAQARLQGQRASVLTQELRLRQAQVLAPDNGIVSRRDATLGAVPPPGQELFRLIRQGRLEWRAEVAAPDLVRVKPGMPVTVTPAGGAPIAGRVRMLAPTVDPATRNGLVYVDLPSPGQARAGMFARGSFEIGSSSGLTLPQGAVLLREGFNWVLRVGPDNKVTQVKVGVGRRVGERVEITSGLEPSARVVASGGGFLVDGDLVRVVAAPVPAAAASR
jgi:HlyD family secretion protein